MSPATPRRATGANLRLVPSTPVPSEPAAAPPPKPSLYERYQPWRRIAEPGFWIVLMLIQFAVNTEVVILDLQRSAMPIPDWKPATWEGSSHLVVALLIPLVIWFDRRLPLTHASWRRNLRWHALASVVFCVLHVGAMVALRKLVYAWMGDSYDFGYWPRELFYEYLKDWRSYLTILLIVGSYDLLLLRLQGEARILDAPDEGLAAAEPVDRPDRFLVRKLGKEFLVAAADIEYLQASGNYVNLHVKGRDYPLRSTMAALEPRLDPARFARVHRSWMVNLDEIAEIEPLETGDARIRMRDNAVVPCSRSYRATLKR